MAEPARENKITSMMPEWSQLNEELLQLISKHLESCFDVVHARSVCSSWRSSFPFPSGLLRPSYSLPAFADFPQESKDLCTFEKVPMFLFRVRTPAAAASVFPSQYFLGGVRQDKSEGCIELLPFPLQSSVEVKIAGYVPRLVNILDCQIIPLGHHYRMIGWNPQDWRRDYKGMAFLQLNEEGGGEFIVLLNYTKFLLVLTSAEMRWKQISDDDSCKGIVTFRGRFYAVFVNGDIFVFDPYSLEATLVMSSHPWASSTYLVSSGNDELFVVEKIIPNEILCSHSDCILRVSRLDEESGKWVKVNDLGDRVLFVGLLGNISCSAKELPDGCGLSGNSILFCHEISGSVTYFYKYGPLTESAEDRPYYWRSSRKNLVRFFDTFPVVAFRLGRIDSIKSNSHWFNRPENANKIVQREEADAAMMMLNSKRQEHASHFHNNWFLRASFCTSVFFNELLSSYNNFKNARVKKLFPDSVCKVARGKAYPNHNWKTDVDVIYGVAEVGKHWIGFVINLNKRTIESLACNHPQENKGRVLDIVTRIAEMIPALLCIVENIKPMKNMVPFKIVHECEERPKSSTISSCGIFVLKKIQCHSLKIEDFSSIIDDLIHDLRSTLA